MNKAITAREVRDIFLSKGPEAINKLIDTAIGFKTDRAGNRTEYTGEVDLPVLLAIVQKMVPMMEMADDREALDIEQANSIEELLLMQNQGVLSRNEVERYTRILKTNFDINTLPELLTKIESLKDD